MVNRRKFIKRGALFVPFIFAPKLLRAGPPFTHPSFWKRPATGGGPTFLVNEDFEGTGTPSGWAMLGAANPDYAISPIQGAQSLQLVGATSDYAALPVFPSGQDEIWVKFRFRADALGTSVSLFVIRDSGFGAIFTAYLIPDGTMSVDFANFTTALTVGNNYYVWLHYKKGSGANSHGDVWLSATDDRDGASHVGFTNGDETAQADNAYFAGLGTGNEFVFDVVQVAAEDFQ